LEAVGNNSFHCLFKDYNDEIFKKTMKRIVSYSFQKEHRPNDDSF
jgi:hypothetical protein